jgi:putative ABC transport system permease protein
MNLIQAVYEALESLNANKMRSGLTVLGIVIGVAAVIAMLAVGQGAQDTITGQISGIGTNLIFVFSGNFNEEVRNVQPLTTGDAAAIADPFQAPSVLAVAPAVSTRGSVVFAGETISTEIVGSTPDYFSVRNFVMNEGEIFNQDQVLGRASVVVLGPDVAEKLFGRQDGIVGESVRIEGQPFRVVGVTVAKGGGSSFGSQDNFVVVPLTSAQTRFVRRSAERVDTIYLQAASAEAVDAAAAEVSDILRVRHRITLGPDDFTVFTQKDFVATAQLITGTFTIFLGGVAGISLLVGGIGIMNIMLVSVTERTREIGLRKALGARKRDILIQFLTESALLSMFGGIIGIGVGWLLAFAVNKIAEASGTPLNPTVGLQAVLLATLFSAAVGIFFGIYPANRAAKLEPVEALRHE